MLQRNEPVKLDGALLADKIVENAAMLTQKLIKEYNIRPHLEVVLVGNDPASKIYVNNKTKACDKVGIFHNTNLLPENISNEELIKFIEHLNNNREVNGILVQLPLPRHLNKDKVFKAIAPIKDVDGIHPYNMGLLMAGKQNWNPCTPGGIIELLKAYNINPEGKHCVIIGRSEIVGKPLALLMMQHNATITVCHSKTKEIPSHLKKADIVCAAMGKTTFVLPDYVNEGAIIIDVGVNRVNDSKIVDEIYGPDSEKKKTFLSKGYALIGDVHPNTYLKSSFYTPVPGGVGPMTIATLIQNTITATKLQLNTK